MEQTENFLSNFRGFRKILSEAGQTLIPVANPTIDFPGMNIPLTCALQLDQVGSDYSGRQSGSVTRQQRETKDSLSTCTGKGLRF